CRARGRRRAMSTPVPGPGSAGTGIGHPAPEVQPATGEAVLAPLRPRSSGAQLVLATLATGAALWAAQPVILPVLLAVFFALIGNPLIRGLQRLYVPRVLGALLVLLAGMAATALLANQLVAPAAEWARQVPREIRKVAPHLREMAKDRK